MILQGGGGVLGAVALQNTLIALAKNRNLKIGDDVMTVGIALQTFTLFVFMVLCGEFALRVRRRVNWHRNPRLVVVRNSLAISRLPGSTRECNYRCVLVIYISLR